MSTLIKSENLKSQVTARLINLSLTADVLLWQAQDKWSGVLPTTYIGGADLGDIPSLIIDPR